MNLRAAPAEHLVLLPCVTHQLPGELNVRRVLVFGSAVWQPGSFATRTCGEMVSLHQAVATRRR
jgi:hypothetical protein